MLSQNRSIYICVWDINALILISVKNIEKLQNDNKTGTQYIANGTNAHNTHNRHTQNRAHMNKNKIWKYIKYNK